jgi:HAD superfamily phosphatase (TIGR01668 family)
MAVYRVRSLLAPCILVRAVWEIDLEALWENGVRGLILDLDNTLVNWNDSHVCPAVRGWVEAAHEKGMGMCLVSNSAGGRRVREVGKDLGLSVVTRAWKPLPIAFRRAMTVMGTDTGSTCAIGDQVFTDMLGANWLGMKTVLVAPLSPRESPHTRLIRLIEAPLRRRWALSQERGAAGVEGKR